MRLNESYLKQQQKAGKIQGYSRERQTKPNKVREQIPAQSAPEVVWMKWNLQYWCNGRALELLTEHHFHPKRKWRFDFCIPALKVAIEYEGIQCAKSRHTTLKGYTGDGEKYTAAQALGWRVIRVTVLNYKDILQMLKSFV